MKKPKRSRAIPEPSEAEVAAVLPKTQTIQLRVSVKDKDEIVACSDLLRLTRTDYLLGCHKVVAGKLGRKV